MSNIIFTQDVKGERGWLQSHFPGHQSLETINSGKWQGTLPNPNGDFLYEIPYSDSIELSDYLHFPANKIKSVYNNQPGFYDKNWYCAETLLSNIEFSDFENRNNTYSIVCTFSRCGTELTEDLLLHRFKKLAPHFVVVSDQENLANVNLIKQAQDVTIVLVYRKSWWDWVISCGIKRHYGAYHYYDAPDLDQFAPFEITESTILERQHELIRTWDFWCNLRVELPGHDFYLLEFSDIVKNYANLSSHQPLQYSKERIISNYHQAKQLFDEKYLDNWVTMSDRCQKHLITMGCSTDMSTVFSNITNSTLTS